MDSPIRRRDTQEPSGSRRSFLAAWPPVFGALAIGAAAGTPAAASSHGVKPYVFVTLDGPDDGGDFGPHTPGTKTSGLQEALDYAHERCRDVYVYGGRGGVHNGEGTSANVFSLEETLRIPWSQDFRMDGGNYVLSYGKSEGPAVQIDSQMNCQYKLGLITSSSKDPTVWIKPETAGPDDLTLIIGSIFEFVAVCSANPRGTSILLDSSKGSITHCKFFAEEFNAAGTGVHLSDAGGAGQPIVYNHIQVMFGNQGHARGHCTGLRLGDPGSRQIHYNHVEMSLCAPQGAHFDEATKRYVVEEGLVGEDAVGADVFAQNNHLSLAFFGARPKGDDLVFEPDARDNTVFAFDLPNGITNKATVPNNRVVANWSVGFAVPTPAVASLGEFTVNMSSYVVQAIILDPGDVSQWTIAEPGPANPPILDKPSPAELRRSQTVFGGLTPSQTITLAPGEKIRFVGAKTPTWRWKVV